MPFTTLCVHLAITIAACSFPPPLTQSIRHIPSFDDIDIPIIYLFFLGTMDTKKQSSLGKAFSRPFKGKKQQQPAGSHATAANDAPVLQPANAVDTLPTTVDPSRTNQTSNGLNNLNGTTTGNTGLHNGNNVSSAYNASTHHHPSNGHGPRQTHASTSRMSPISPPDSPDVHFAINTNPSRPVQATLTNKELSSHSLPPLPFEAKHARDATAMTNTSTLSRISAGLSSPTSFSSSGDDSFFGGDGYGQNPADLLQTRLDAYRGVIKNLQQFFAEVAVVESGASRAWSKAAAVLVVPFKDGHQFLGKGGLQDVCAGLRDSAKMRGEQHAGAARFVEETVVKHLRRLKQDLKGKIRAIRMDTNLYNNRVFRERELTQEKVGGLARAIGLYEKAGGFQAEESMRLDPYLVNLGMVFLLIVALFVLFLGVMEWRAVTTTLNISHY